MFTSTPLFIGGLPGGMEWAVILLIAVLLFGANKIPKLARSSGQAIGEFQKGREEVESELEEIRNDADPTAEDEEDSSLESDTTTSTSADTSSSTSTDTSSSTSTDTDSTSSN